MGDVFQTYDDVGPRHIIKGKSYFPRLQTDYSKTSKELNIFNFGFTVEVSDDTSRDAEPDSSLGYHGVHVAVNKSPKDVVFKPYSDKAEGEIRSLLPGVFNHETFYRMFLPIWNRSKKY